MRFIRELLRMEPDDYENVDLNELLFHLANLLQDDHSLFRKWFPIHDDSLLRKFNSAFHGDISQESDFVKLQNDVESRTKAQPRTGLSFWFKGQAITGCFDAEVKVYVFICHAHLFGSCSFYHHVFFCDHVHFYHHAHRVLTFSPLSSFLIMLILVSCSPSHHINFFIFVHLFHCAHPFSLCSLCHHGHLIIKLPVSPSSLFVSCPPFSSWSLIPPCSRCHHVRFVTFKLTSYTFATFVYMMFFNPYIQNKTSYFINTLHLELWNPDGAKAEVRVSRRAPAQFGARVSHVMENDPLLGLKVCGFMRCLRWWISSSRSLSSPPDTGPETTTFQYHIYGL